MIPDPDPRPRVLLVTRNLPPLRGGMERLNQHIVIELDRGADVTVIGPEGCRQHLPDRVIVREVPTRSLWRFLLRSMVAAWREATGDIAFVMAGSGLTAPATLLAARRSGAKSVAYVHGLDLVTRHPVYRWLWMPALRWLDVAFANSASTADLAMRAGVARGSVLVLHPGARFPDAAHAGATEFRARFGLGDAPLLLSVGRLTERKGLQEFVAAALPRIVAMHPDVRLVIIGDDAPDALHKGKVETGKYLLELADVLGLQGNLCRLGPCDDATLDQAYAAADVHVFPVRHVPGDIEGFGMVAIEAAMHGLPTVAFAVGGVPDAVADGGSGYLLRPGDYEGFSDRVCDVIAAGRTSPLRASARAFASDFAWGRFGERLRAMLQATQIKENPLVTQTRGHAVLDLESRDAKARKIERLLSLAPGSSALRVLEIGTGSGGIAHYFGTHPRIACEVDSVDVDDSRQIRQGYRFSLVNGPQLPFADNSFDVVISNHVIEHVGDPKMQQIHLTELRRVLAPSGVGYLAVPSRWQLVEPHYRIAFLSWLPERWRTPYLRLRGRGHEYDCRPLSVAQLEGKLRHAGFGFVQQHGRALRATYELERPAAAEYTLLLKHLPDWFYAALRRLFPTLIYTLRVKGDSGA